MTHAEIAQTMTRTEIITAIAEKLGTSKAKLITRTTSDLVVMLAETFVQANTEKSPKAKKTTRTCKICGCEKPLSEYGPTHKQVACKGECLKEYTRQAIARAKARANAAVAEAERLERVSALGLELAPQMFVGPKVLFAKDEQILLVA
jgi:hypothetical protein